MFPINPYHNLEGGVSNVGYCQQLIIFNGVVMIGTPYCPEKITKLQSYLILKGFYVLK